MSSAPTRTIDEVRDVTQQQEAIVRVQGDFDLDNYALYVETAKQILDDTSGDCLVVDLGGVTFMSSLGLAYLVRLRFLAGERGRSIRLRSVPAAVSRLLTITGLQDVFESE